MNPYVVLGTAILAEVIGTTSLKLSQGFSRPLPSLGVLVGYGAAFYGESRRKPRRLGRG